MLWIFSNCRARQRKQYAKELQRNGLVIDKFGRCGKPDPCQTEIQCVKEMSAKCKFYLAFENSLCEDYITEKTCKYLQYGLVPIALGPSIKTYKEHLPPNSFIHVENFTSPVELVKYIKYLDSNSEAYSRHHDWREQYTVIYRKHTENITFLWVCDICKKINGPLTPTYKNISQWWTPEVQCRK